MHQPFQIARWALLAGFAVMVFVVAFPNPNPGQAWKLAESSRYEQKVPAFKNRIAPTNSPRTQLANHATAKPTIAGHTKKTPAKKPIQTAQLPSRFESQDDLPRGVKIQEPILFFEDEEPPNSNLAPDPVHLETPSDLTNP